MRWLVILAVLTACGGGDDGDDLDGTAKPKSACGDVTEWDVIVHGLVHLDGAPAAGAGVQLEETHWHPGGKVFATGVTDASGQFTLDAPGIISVDDCWGTAVDYVIRAELGGATAERGVNSRLFSAIHGGGGEADLSSFPLELQ